MSILTQEQTIRLNALKDRVRNIPDERERAIVGDILESVIDLLSELKRLDSACMV